MMSSHFCTSLLCLNCGTRPVPVAAKNSLRSNSSNSPCARDRQQLVRHLVGEQAHLRQRAVRVPLAGVLARANSSLARCSSVYVQLKICSSMNSPVASALNGVPER